MPKVSVIIQKGGHVPSGPYNYSYAEFVRGQKRTFFSTITSIFTWMIGFCVVVVLFAVPVALTSVLLINTMSSQGVVTIKTQYVPSDGNDQYIPEKTQRLVVPADK